jgi:hypothetical protein
MKGKVACIPMRPSAELRDDDVKLAYLKNPILKRSSEIARNVK